jgi:hypothetical protein
VSLRLNLEEIKEEDELNKGTKAGLIEKKMNEIFTSNDHYL